MRFGVCAQPQTADIIKDAGFSYIEVNAQKHLMPFAAEKDFAEMHKILINCALPCTLANCLFPASLRLTGKDADLKAVEKYVSTAFRRASETGIKTIVFGSGAARNVPDGFPRKKALLQLTDAGRVIAETASKFGITVAVEPLCDSNILTTVGETAEYVKAVDIPCFRLLVDRYHFRRVNDSWDDMLEYGDLIAHTHVATMEHRLAPGMEENDFSPFFSVLKRIGYDGTMSFDGAFADTDIGGAARAAYAILDGYASYAPRE